MNSLLGEGCSAWKLFIDLAPDANLLLLGGGLENLANNLAPDVGKVFALDCQYSSLEFTRENTTVCSSNSCISGVAGGDGTGLPFADDSMDIVVLAGVLEHLAEGDKLRFTQLSFLREIRRILKAEGQIFIGAENRLSYARSLGSGGVPGVITRLSSLFGRGQQPRSYPHSLRGYKRLLARAGFPQIDFLGLLQDERFIEEIVPVDGKFSRWQAPRNIGWRERFKRSRFLVPTYGIIASARTSHGVSTQAKIADAVAEAIGCQAPEAAKLRFHKYEVTGKQKLMAHASNGSQRLLIKHTFDAQGTESERNNHAILIHLSEHRPKLTGVPRAITCGVIDQQVFYAETAVEGRPLKYVVRGEQRLQLVKSALDFLLGVNPPNTCEHVLLDDALFEQYVGAKLDRIIPLLKEPAQATLLATFFRKNLLGKNMLLGVAHGDFSSNNILVEGSRVSGVFDWEAGSVRDIPARDGISLLVSVHRASGADSSLAECLAMLANRQWPDPVEFRALTDLYAAMGIDEDCHAGIVYLSWLNGMDLRLRYGMDKDPVAIARFIHDVVGAATLD